jgi:hypothetical protein
MQFDRYIGQTPIKNLHIPRSKFLIGEYGGTKSIKFFDRILTSNPINKISNVLSGRLLMKKYQFYDALFCLTRFSLIVPMLIETYFLVIQFLMFVILQHGVSNLQLCNFLFLRHENFLLPELLDHVLTSFFEVQLSCLVTLRH